MHLITETDHLLVISHLKDSWWASGKKPPSDCLSDPGTYRPAPVLGLGSHGLFKPDGNSSCTVTKAAGTVLLLLRLI